MTPTVERHVLTVTADDFATARLQLHVPAQAQVGLYWLPALGVGIGPNETLADALAAQGVAVAVHEWRGLGDSDRRAARRCDWGYKDLLDIDIAAGLAAARARCPGLRWYLGGHSLGGQLALLQASLIQASLKQAGLQQPARHADEFDGVLLVASGQPHWRAFPGWRSVGVLGFALALPAVTNIVGHFPGATLGFAGREAATLMREWAGTAITGHYRIRAFGTELDDALAAYTGRVLAIRMSEDRLAPSGAIDRLRALTPRADWSVQEFGRAEIVNRRPNHFGWLREPTAVAAAFAAWRDR